MALPSKQACILCVEPSSVQQTVLARLAAAAGYAVEACAGATQALSILHRSKFDLILVARQLSEGDSFHLIESIRLSPEHAMLPIAFIAAECDSPCAHRAMIAGATEVFLRQEQSELASFIANWGQTANAETLIGRALVLEDSLSHAGYVEGICCMLGFEVDVATTIDVAYRLYQPGHYQLVIADLLLPGARSGAAFVRQIRSRPAGRQPILVMSAYSDQTQRLQALKSGADDFISKPFLPEELVWRIRRILRAYAAFDLGCDDLPVHESAPGLSLLSPREREVCRRILGGASDKVIAQQLGISFWTVRSHIEQIFVKTGALNRRDLMARFVEK